MKTTALAAMALLAALIATVLAFSSRAVAQDDDSQDDPPSRVARLGYLTGSVSFNPAGEGDWVDAAPNRPMTIGDKLWSDQGSRAELQLGSAVVRLSENTGVSFLNLDDQTIQLQLSSGAINVRVRELDPNSDFEIDTPNLAFTIEQPGSYRIEASEDGSSTLVGIRSGGGEATGNGQTYTIHQGQVATFGGTDSLNADVEQLGPPDDFDSWAYNRDRRWDGSRSAQYLSRDCVGYEDLDDYGDWRDDPNYGHVWYPNRVDAGWAPYHTGHWDWIDPWGYTWVDDEPWGYAPFHYGRWAFVTGRWGWIPGPVAVRPVYAPALVVFVGGGGGVIGGNVAWFPLGPREVYVPSYRVSRGYVDRVNVSNTVVNTTVITNVYNTTIVNRSTTITNVTYANRNVRGAVMAVPQNAFVSAQPVARAAVRVDERQLAAAPVSVRVAVNPTRQAVFGARADTAGRAKAPPAAVMQRQVIAKKAPPPPPPSFAVRQQAMAKNPGQPIGRREAVNLRQPAGAAGGGRVAAAPVQPMVKVAPAGKPATPTTGQPNRFGNRGGNQPGNNSNNAPGMNNQPGGNRPNQPGQVNPNQPNPNQPNRPNQPAMNNRAPQNAPNNQPGQNDQPGANVRPNENNRPNNRPPEPNNPNENPNANRPPRNPNNQPGENNPSNTNRPFNRPEQQPNNRPPNATPNNPNNPNVNPNPNRPPEQPNNRTPNVAPNNPNANPNANRPPNPPANNPDNNSNNPNRPNNNYNRPNGNNPNNANGGQPNDRNNDRNNVNPRGNPPNNQPDNTNRPPQHEANPPANNQQPPQNQNRSDRNNQNNKNDKNEKNEKNDKDNKKNQDEQK